MIFLRRNFASAALRAHWSTVFIVILSFTFQAGAQTSNSASNPTAQLEEELRQAKAADQAGDYAAAAKGYQAFLDHVSPTQIRPVEMLELRTRLATLYFLSHEFRESLGLARTVTSSKSVPVPPQAWVVQGLDQLELNQVPDAIASLRLAVRLNPASGTARLALGDALARSNNLEGAISEFREQLRRTPNEVEAWYKLGLAYAFLTKQTVGQFRERYPKDPLGLQLTAEAAISNGKYTEALSILFGLAESNASEAGLHADLGTALLDLGFPQTAEAQFQQELKGNPHCPEALFGMSIIQSLRGDWSGVASNLASLEGSNPRDLERLLQSSPPVVLREALNNKKVEVPAQFTGTSLGSVWTNWLQDSAAGVNLEAPAGEACHEVAASNGLEPGNWTSDACYRSLARRLSKTATTQASRDKLAEAELRDGDYTAAEAEARRALQASPSDGWAVYWLVQSYDALGYQAFQKLSALNPNSARVHQIMGKYYADKHETAHAVSEFQAALKLSPNLPDLDLGLGTVYWEAGDWDHAEPPLREALQLSPSMLNASYELGDVYVQKRQWELAVRYLRPARDDETLHYKVCLDLSKAEAGLGHTQEAVDDLVPFVAQDPDGEIHYRLGVLYRKLGDKAKADDAFVASTRLRQASLHHGEEVLQTMEKERQALDETGH